MGEYKCDCEKHVTTARDDEYKKALTNRLNRIIGQLGGVKSMVENDRYCKDILIQIGAIESALQSFGYLILKEHLEVCVVEQIKQGNLSITDDTLEIIKNLK